MCGGPRTVSIARTHSPARKSGHCAQLRRENLQSRYVFNTERGGPATRAWFLKMVRRTGELAKLAFPAHPHMLRHGCGFKLANDGVDTRALQHYLGHRSITHTVRYTELRSDRFDGTEGVTRAVRVGNARYSASPALSTTPSTQASRAA